MADNLLYRRILTSILFALGILIVLRGYWQDPDPWGEWLATCPLLAATGLHCPLCGGQRALHALLHGDWAQAWQANPGVLLFPLVLIGVYLMRRSTKLPRAFPWASRVSAIGLPAIIMLFALIRNVW